MKVLATLLFILTFCLSGTSQITSDNNTNVGYNKARLTTIQTIRDLVFDMPDSLSYVSFEILGKVKGFTTKVTNSGDSLNPQALELLKTVDVNSKIYFDLKYAGKNNAPHATTFSIKVMPY